ncbi:MAG TPA: glycosyltransferase family 2 protein [Verrucomicrobiae bacterium]|nr:glycosyltransferase family 2 protein [Verrucomicrobiae bacterium]
MKQPAISVVIPSHKRAAMVQRAVASVLAQTVPDLEIIVVLDGADPASEAALAQVEDPRLRVIPVAEAVGGSEARNIGIRAARAEWLALLDDDDEWMPDKLAKQIAVAEASKQAFPIVATALIARSPLADFRWPRKTPTTPISEYLFVRNSLFQGEAVLQTSTWLTKAELLRKVPFTRGLRRHQDWDWILRAVKNPGTSLEFINEPLAIWYVDDPNSPIRTQYDWRYSLQWIKANRELVTARAYAGLMAVTLSSQAAWQRDWRAFWPLLRETIFGGRPRAMDLALFFAMWFVPRKVRHSVRSLMTRQTASREAAAAPVPPRPEAA